MQEVEFFELDNPTLEKDASQLDGPGKGSKAMKNLIVTKPSPEPGMK